MKRWMSLLIVLLGLAPLVCLAGQEADSALLLVTARPARVELPQGAPQADYRLVEEGERVYELHQEAYVAVPEDIPVEGTEIRQAQVQDFPIYISEFKQSLEHTAFLIDPPEKGDGIPYTEYSLLYRAAVAGESILSLTYYQLD